MDIICDVCMEEFDTLIEADGRKYGFEYNGMIVCKSCLQQLEEEEEGEDKESDNGIS